MDTRHTSEDLAFLREKGFVQTADEIERLHAVEDRMSRLKGRLYSRLNDYLCEMKPGHDDSIAGFNDAWDVMRKTLDQADAASGEAEKIKYWWSGDREWFCVLINDGINQATVSLTVEEAEALMDEVMQTPSFLEFQEKCRNEALRLVGGADAR